MNIHNIAVSSTNGKSPEGYSHVKAYRDGLPFHQKSLDKGPSLVKKILRRGSYFTKVAKKIVKSKQKNS